ncbi:MAG: hypothetical protein G8237_11940 [Magnetococcales bacterium]|nr:hypothetical protein [Magnetococcales bacterium]NGZ07055.1 hypothetical protein [Magnetococcales bacterium]
MSTLDLIQQQVVQLPERMRQKLLRHLLVLMQQNDMHAHANSLSSNEYGEGLERALRVATSRNLFQEITDPVAWQRAIRCERDLPGRNGSEHDD